MTKKEYHDNEMRLLRKQLDELKNATKQEKAEAKRSLLECWNDYPKVYGERVSWLLNGTYGYGAMVEALKIADNKKLNRVAGLSQLVAAIEWQCTQAVTASAFKALPAEKQAQLSAIVQVEIDYFEANREEYQP